MTTQALHAFLVRGGDLVDAAIPAVVRAGAVLAGLLLVPAVAYGAWLVAGAAGVGLDHARLLTVQVLTAVAASSAMSGVLLGIDRFNRRIPVVER